MKLTPTMEIGDTVEFTGGYTGEIDDVMTFTFAVNITLTDYRAGDIADFEWDETLNRWVQR